MRPPWQTGVWWVAYTPGCVSTTKLDGVPVHSWLDTGTRKLCVWRQVNVGPRMREDDGREAAPTPRIIRESDARALPRREQPTRTAPAEAALEASVRGVRRKRRLQTQATQTLANACLRARTACAWSWRATTQAAQATQ